jgi:hypothetical protein
MNNKQFAEDLTRWISRVHDQHSAIDKKWYEDDIETFLEKNHLTVINTKDSFVSLTTEDIMSDYPELTLENAREVLEMAGNLNSNYEGLLSWEDVENAMDDLGFTYGDTLK